MNIFKFIYQETIKHLYYSLECNTPKECMNEAYAVSKSGNKNLTFINKNIFIKFKKILLETIKTNDDDVILHINNFEIRLSYNDTVKEIIIVFFYDDESNVVHSRLVLHDTRLGRTLFTTDFNSNIQYIDDLPLNEWENLKEEIAELYKKRITNVFDDYVCQVKDILKISRNEKIDEMNEIFKEMDYEKCD